MVARIRTGNLVLVLRFSFRGQFLWRFLLTHQRIRFFLGQLLYFFSLLYVILQSNNESKLIKARTNEVNGIKLPSRWLYQYPSYFS